MCAWIPLALLAPLVLGETNFLDRIVWPTFFSRWSLSYSSIRQQSLW